jgi:hypothetical protein
LAESARVARKTGASEGIISVQAGGAVLTGVARAFLKQKTERNTKFVMGLLERKKQRQTKAVQATIACHSVWTSAVLLF